MKLDQFVKTWFSIRGPLRGLAYAMFSLAAAFIFYCINSLIAKTAYASIVWFTLSFFIVISFLKLLSIILKDREKLKELSIHDALTGLYNRHFLENLSIIISRAARHGEFVFLCFIDVNRLKYINDTFGHPVGDNALRVIAKTLMRNVRLEDVVIRYGGDEFIIFWISSDLNKSDEFICRINTALSHITFFHDEEEISLSATVGFNCGPAKEKGILEELLKKADKAMLDSKKAAR